MTALRSIAATVLTGFQQSDTITQGPFTFTFSQPVTAMLTEDGLHLVVAPPGTTLTGYTPGPTTLGSHQVGGAMLNPLVRGGSSHVQGFDSRAAGFSLGARPTFPLPVGPGNVFLASTPASTIGTSDWQRRGVVEAYGALFFVPSFPSGAGIFAPAVGGWSGRAALTAYAVDLDAYLDTLPAYSLAGVNAPPVQPLVDIINRFHGGGYLTPGTTGGYEHMMPRGSGGGTNMNYGRTLANVFGAAGLHLVGDTATRAQKRVILKRFVQMAINWYDPGAAGTAKPFCDGGHHQFEIVPIAVGLHAMGRTAALDTLHTVFSGLHQFGQVFIWTPELIAGGGTAMHTSDALPYYTRRREVRWVNPNDSRRFVVRQRPAQADPAKMTFGGGRIVRDGDGAEAIGTRTELFSKLETMVALGIPAERTDLLAEPGSIHLTIDAPLSPPLAEGDFIYGQPMPGHTIVAGDPAWKIRAELSTYSPLPGAQYLTLADFADDLLVLRAIPGLWRTAWEPLRQIVVKSQPQDWPDTANPYYNMQPSVSVGGTFNFSRTFWNAHAASLGLT